MMSENTLYKLFVTTSQDKFHPIVLEREGAL